MAALKAAGVVDGCVPHSVRLKIITDKGVGTKVVW